MKVYIAQAHYDYEGFSIIGVYATKEAAELAVEEKRRSGGYADSYEVEEFEVQ